MTSLVIEMRSIHSILLLPLLFSPRFVSAENVRATETYSRSFSLIPTENLFYLFYFLHNSVCNSYRDLWSPLPHDSNTSNDKGRKEEDFEHLKHIFYISIIPKDFAQDKTGSISIDSF